MVRNMLFEVQVRLLCRTRYLCKSEGKRDENDDRLLARRTGSGPNRVHASSGVCLFGIGCIVQLAPGAVSAVSGVLLIPNWPLPTHLRANGSAFRAGIADGEI
jgi:hypothetical protein